MMCARDLIEFVPGRPSPPQGMVCPTTGAQRLTSTLVMKDVVAGRRLPLGTTLAR
jgi:hypothetical protein